MAGNVITPPDEWTPDQVLDPEALVDLFVFDGDNLTHAEPGSTVKPPAPPTTIGTVSISGNTDIETGSASELSCVCSGDATDLVYRWSTGCGSIAIVGPKTNMTVQVSGISATSGNCWLLCAVTSATASDSSGDSQASMTVSDPPSATKTTAKAAKK